MNEVEERYARWVYPEPVEDIAEARRQGHRDAADPGVLYAALWPDREWPRPIDILVAGCGTNQAAMLAYCNPGASVLGIDTNDGALAHSRNLKVQHSLSNLELERHDLVDASRLPRRFDLIVCTGVLHYLDDPAAALEALAAAMKPDGALVLKVYGRFFDEGLAHVRRLARLLRLTGSDEDLATLRALLERLPANHVARIFLSEDTDHHRDEGLLGLVLREHVPTYDIAGCLALLEQSGLAHRNWLDNAQYYPEQWIARTDRLFGAITRLTEADTWKAMESFWSTMANHDIVACHADARTTLRFDTPEFLDHRPALADGIVSAPDAERPGMTRISRLDRPSLSLLPSQLSLLRSIDGQRCIRECIALSELDPTIADPESFACTFIRELWRIGMVFLRLPADGRRETPPL